ESGSAVVPVNHSLRVRGIDPQCVMVAVWRAERSKCFSSVGRAEQAGVELVNRVHTFGVGEDVGEIPRALAEAMVVIHLGPFLARVVGAKNPSLLGFDLRVDAI